MFQSCYNFCGPRVGTRREEKDKVDQLILFNLVSDVELLVNLVYDVLLLVDLIYMSVLSSCNQYLIL